VKWEPSELRRVTRSDPGFERELAYATREVEQESEARALQSLRAQMDGTDPRAALTAAKAVLNYLTRKRVERTRRELAYLRAEVDPPHDEKPARVEAPRPLSEEASRSSQQERATGRVPTDPAPTRNPDKGPFLKPPGPKPTTLATRQPYDDAPAG
jgi:hypothetical protein